jgi:hypothetical protein
MLVALREIQERTLDENKFQGDAPIRHFRAELASMNSSTPPVERWRVLRNLGDARVYFGEEREGLALMQEAYDLLPKARPMLGPSEEAGFLLRFATGWLRLAETENCCARNTPGSCILPLEGAAIHTEKEGSTRAMALFDEVLRGTDPSSQLHLDAQWLMNMAAMTLGLYPDGVPAADRIPPAYFAGDEEFPRFENVAAKVGLDYRNLAGGVVADDFDNDGRIDLMISSWSTKGQLQYFHNDGGERFSNRTKEAGLTGLTGGLNLIQGDYDNDGFVDVLILRGAWLDRGGRQPNSLLHNNGDGTFTDRAYEAGIAGDGKDLPTVTGVFLDYDNDGLLDLYVGNETSPSLAAPSQLFHNDGNGRFTDVAAAAGVTNDQYTRAVFAGDYDGDGYPDLYVSNLNQPNRLYHNRRNGTFEDVGPALGVTKPLRSYAGWFWDYDNDGILDILVLPFESKPHDFAAAALGRPFDAELPALYHGNGKGGFEEVGKASGLVKPFSAMGCNVGDFDDDGYPDFYVGTGRPLARDLIPNMAYHNLRGKGFADVTLPSRMGHLQKGHGIAFADFDDDGDLDIFAQMGGAFRADLFHNAFFENPGFGNHSLAIRLRGVKTNRSAIGVRVRADIVEGGKPRSVYGVVGSGGSFGANPLLLHLGLGKATRVETLEVTWPTTGKSQVFRDIPADRAMEITEGVDRPTVRELHPAKLGGGKR